jgi:single-strand DNA-binding protein
VDVDLWSRQAEIAQQYLHKGSPLFVEGRLKYDQWDDKQSGQKRSKLKVVGERIQLLGGPRGENAGAGEGAARPAARPARPSAPPPAEEPPPAEGEDNIPF